MKFISIDFNVYNRPPYYPQYLSRGETKKLISFDDRELEELDRLIDRASEQYDLDKAKGILLDRIGKIVSEPREGTDDKLYQLLIRLRILLNTTDGSVNDVIKVVKFIFSSEVVHIQPNYPAGISILHDGESPSVDFNKYISQVVGAGIAYDTKELFFFSEDFPFTEHDTKTVLRDDKEMFSDTVFRNGRVLRDGTTVLDTEEDYLFRNGTVLRDGTVIRDGWYRKPAFGRIKTPIYRNSGIQDTLELVFGNDYADVWQSNLFRNGALVRDGSADRGGKAPVSMNDALDFDTVGHVISDKLPFHDNQEKTVAKNDVDQFGHKYMRDGTYLRNGRIYRASYQIIDVLEMHTEEPPMIDINRASLVRNGIITRDGTYTRSGYADETMIDSMLVGKRFHYFRNGAYTRDGTILRNGDTFIPLG
jgi:hypothetical protein